MVARSGVVAVKMVRNVKNTNVNLFVIITLILTNLRKPVVMLLKLNWSAKQPLGWDILQVMQDLNPSKAWLQVFKDWWQFHFHLNVSGKNSGSFNLQRLPDYLLRFQKITSFLVLIYQHNPKRLEDTEPSF